MLIFTGAQPSNHFHLGNYFGFIKQIINFQQNNEQCLVFLADLHSFTSLDINKNDNTKQEVVYSTLAMLLACGIDYTKIPIFQQSSQPEHIELFWYLSSIVPRSWLNNMVQYKEKTRTNEDSLISLYLYPILMAADIIIYNPTHVPTGPDQKQHIELTRKIIDRLVDYGCDFLNKIDTINNENTIEIKNLKFPEKKMSKSTDNQGVIFLNDDQDTVSSKIRKSITDSDLIFTVWPQDLKNRPGLENLINIYLNITNINKNEFLQRFGGADHKYFKEKLAFEINQFLTPIREKYNLYIKNKKYLNQILNEGVIFAKENSIFKKIKNKFFYNKF